MPTDLSMPKLGKLANLPLPPSVRTDPDVREMTGRPPLTGPNPHTSLPATQIVPEEYQNRLMAIDDTMTRAYFEIGDIANALIRFAPQVSQDGRQLVTQQDVYDAVGVFCRRRGRTVRYYAETAAFYAPDVRREFEMLPFAHFDAARSYGSAWRQVLEYARDHPAISEDALRQHFIGLNADQADKESFYADHPKIADILAKHMGDVREPGDEQSDVPSFRIQNKGDTKPSALLLSRLCNLADSCERILFVVDTDMQERVKAILAEVRGLVSDMQKKVETDSCDIM